MAIGFRYASELPSLEVVELRELARISGAWRGKKEKGGKYRKLRKEELVREIRRSLASTFPSRILRANDYIGSLV